jgi:alanine racemase
MASFERVLGEARRRGLLRGWIHASNSAALFTGLEPRYDTVRPGIGAYGIPPGDLPAGVPGLGELRPVMTLRSQVVFLKDVPAGAPVGYASSWRAPRRTRIATLPLGYNDGVPWRLGNVGEVVIRGARAPIVGRVSMDYTTIDVGHVPGARVGDVVTLFGRGEPGSAPPLSAEDLARLAGTIAYEVTCSVGKRVRRVYLGGLEIPLPAQPPLREDLQRASRPPAADPQRADRRTASEGAR